MKRKSYATPVVALPVGTRVRRKSYAPRRYSSGSAAVYQTVPRSRGIYSRGEMKYFDSEKSATAVTIVTTTWPAGTIFDPTVTPVNSINTLFCPKDGSAINQRIGREVNVFKIKIRGEVLVAPQAGASTADYGSALRMLLVLDTQTNATQMTSAQLLQDQTAANQTLQTWMNLANIGRFRILKDKFMVLEPKTMANDTGATGGLVQGGLTRLFKMSVRFKKPIKVRFNATNGGTIADIVDNSFHFVCGTDSTALSPTVNYTCRVSYKE